MRKLLSILASVGLTATAATSVVACTASISANDVNILQNGYVSISDKKIDLPTELKATGTDANLADTLNLKAFDKNGNLMNDVQGLTINLTKATTKSTKKGKSVKVNISFFLGTDLPTKKKMTIKLGTAKGNNKLDYTAVEISAKTPIEWDNATYAKDGTVTFVTSATLAKDGTAVDKSQFTLTGTDGKTPVTINDAKSDNGQLTVTFKASETRSDKFTQQLAYNLVSNNKDLSFKSGQVIFTIPQTGLPLDPSDINNGGNGDNGLAPDASGNITKSFAATIKKEDTTDPNKLAALFAIEGNGKKVDGTYSFKADNVSQDAYVLDTTADMVKGTVTVKFNPSTLGDGQVDVTIGLSDEAKNSGAVTGFTPVKVTVDTYTPMSVQDWANVGDYDATAKKTVKHKLWLTADMQKQQTFTDANVLSVLWSEMFDARSASEAKESFEKQGGANNFSVTINNIDMTKKDSEPSKPSDGIANITVKITGVLVGELHNGEDKLYSVGFSGTATFDVDVYNYTAPATK